MDTQQASGARCRCGITSLVVIVARRRRIGRSRLVGICFLLVLFLCRRSLCVRIDRSAIRTAAELAAATIVVAARESGAIGAQRYCFVTLIRPLVSNRTCGFCFQKPPTSVCSAAFSLQRVSHPRQYHIHILFARALQTRPPLWPCLSAPCLARPRRTRRPPLPPPTRRRPSHPTKPRRPL
jgi:hypothetical protein